MITYSGQDVLDRDRAAILLVSLQITTKKKVKKWLDKLFGDEEDPEKVETIKRQVIYDLQDSKLMKPIGRSVIKPSIRTVELDNSFLFENLGYESSQDNKGSRDMIQKKRKK